MFVDVHILIANKVSALGNWHTTTRQGREAVLARREHWGGGDPGCCGLTVRPDSRRRILFGATRGAILRKSGMTFQLLVVAIAMAPASAHAQWKTPWSYEGARGPEHWGDLDPDYAACRVGKEQSPIDIRKAQKTDLPSIRFEYQSSPLKYLIN